MLCEAARHLAVSREGPTGGGPSRVAVETVFAAGTTLAPSPEVDRPRKPPVQATTRNMDKLSKLLPEFFLTAYCPEVSHNMAEHHHGNKKNLASLEEIKSQAAKAGVLVIDVRNRYGNGDDLLAPVSTELHQYATQWLFVKK